jgi:predicted RNase H-like HicB family nuclease
MKFRVHVEADEDGVFGVECPTLPGCISQGQTRSEALDNIKDAIAGYLFSLEKQARRFRCPSTKKWSRFRHEPSAGLFRHGRSQGVP